jgi:cysteine desulfurase
MREVYLDHNATTPLHPRAREAMAACWDQFGNPSSHHWAGRRAARLSEEARERIAALLGAEDPDEICFTGSGSEANNLALAGAIHELARVRGPGRRVVSTRIEHPSVLEALAALRRSGVEVDLVGVDPTGLLDLEAFAAALRRPADLVSVMLANNEVGTIQPVSEAARLAHEAGALMHVDAIQGVGKLALSVRELGADLLAGASHKMNGPQGVGFLYVRRGVALAPLIHGGGQERGRRAGTENLAGIVGTGAAAAAWLEEGPAERLRTQSLRDRLWDGIAKSVEAVQRFGHPQRCLPGTLALGFEGVHSEPLMLRLDLEGIAVSAGSACHSGSAEPSPVLRAMGVPAAAARGFLRVSAGLGNSGEDVDHVLGVLPAIVESLRALAPR